MSQSQPTITVKCPACRSEFVPQVSTAIPYDCARCSSKVVGAYCDLQLIGTGAMGEVYRARRPDMRDRQVAIKIPKTSDEQFRQRFEREIAASAMLQHENIVRAFDCGEIAGHPFLAMELEDGELLADLARAQHPLPCYLIGSIVHDVARGIAHANRHGIVNRDIKPENVLVSAGGHAKILDFGLATIADSEGAGDRVTGPGIRLGTAAFMAPEQARDPREVNTAADIYSLGCTAFFGLKAGPPFRGRLAEIARQHMESPRPPIRDGRPDVPLAFESLILRMMAIDPSERPTAETVLAEMFSLLPSLPRDTNGLAIAEGELIEDGEPIDDDPPPPMVHSDSDAPTIVDVDHIVTGAIITDEQVPTGEPIDDEPEIAEPTIDDVIEGPTIVSNTPDQVAKPKPITRKQKARSHRNRFLVTAFGGIALMVLVWLAARPFLGPPDAQTVWSEIQEEYQLHKWKLVETRLSDFERDYPEDPHLVEIPFFLAMCNVGRDVFSQTGDAAVGLEKIEQVFVDYRDTQEYDKYCADLFQSLQRLIERLVETTERSWLPEPLVAARRAHELLQTVAQSMPDDWVPGKVSALRASIRSTEKQLEVVMAKRRTLSLLGAVVSNELDSDTIDKAYDDAKTILVHYPQLNADSEIVQAYKAAYEAEASRVTYEPFADDELPAASPAMEEDDETVFVVWDEPSTSDTPSTSGAFLALADGVLYAFDDSGKHLWSHRLGIDSDRLPITLKPSPTSPDAVIAVSSVDNSLLAIAAKTGRVLWRYQPDHDTPLSASLTVSGWRPAPNKPPRVRGMIPTENGDLHVLELVRGRRIGRFKTNVPLTGGGTFDPHTQLLFFPADSKRVFALDPSVIESRKPNDKAVRSMLFTNHLSGSLRSRPVVVGQYLLLTELLDLENTRVRAFELLESDGFFKADAPPVSERKLHGWSWFPPPVTPDRMTIITDSGELGVLGLNLDNREEALYPLIHDGTGRSPSLAIDVPYRAMAIHSDEHLLWVVAGGTLRQIALDVLSQEVHQLWPIGHAEAAVVGMPLHRANFDRESERIYVATRSLDASHSEFTSVDANTGERLWSRQLGVHPVGETIVSGRVGMMIDQSGRALQLVDSPNGDDHSELTLIADDPPLDAATVGELMRLRDRNGHDYVALPIESGRAVAVRPLDASQPLQAPWQTITLPAASLQGRPAILDGYLVAPCSNGSLYRLPLAGSPPAPRNEQTFQWAAESAVAPGDRAFVCPLAEDRIALVYRNSVRWLEYRVTEAVGQWHQLAEALSPETLSGDYALTKTHVFLRGGHRSLVRLTRDGSRTDPELWNLESAITAGPFLDNEILYVVIGGRKLAALSPDDSEPLWTAGPFDGQIRGRPVRLGRALLVTDASGVISGVRPESGAIAGQMHLKPGAVPVGAAVPLGRRLVVPLADGSIAWHNPRPKAASAKPSNARGETPTSETGGAR